MRCTSGLFPLLMLSGLLSAADTFPFAPGQDPLTDSPIDLSYLNTPIEGWIRLDGEGGFVDGQGKPIRFWSAHNETDEWSSGQRKRPDADFDRHYRWLAKYGVNMARIHVSLCQTKGNDIMAVDEDVFDGVWRSVAFAKKHGIYQTMSPLWAHWPTPAAWGLEGVAGKNPYGLIFFNETLQTAYKHWLTELMTRPNPYTGIPLKDDPALAIIHMHNEDSLFFWTFQGLPEPQKRLLGQRFGTWASERYGSIDKALAAWDGHHIAGDDSGAGVLGLIPNWQFNDPQPGGFGKRCTDQVRFMMAVEQAWYEGMATYLREEVGCKQLFNGTCWRTSNEETLGDVQRYTNAGLDVMTTNRYAGSVHIGEQAAWRVDVGHQYKPMSTLLHPEQFAVNLKQPVGKPFLVTETSIPNPSPYKVEWPFLGMAYMSLTGVDSMYFFDHNAVTWSEGDGTLMPWFKPGKSLHKFAGATPDQTGMFPALALAFRRGDVTAAKEAVLTEHRTLESMVARQQPAIVEEGFFDPNRDTIRDVSNGQSRYSLHTYLAGPVMVDYDAKRDAVDEHRKLASLIDGERGEVRSITGELLWNYKDGWATVDAPRFQGACGFLNKAGAIKLDSVSITSGNDYGAICVVSLDGKELGKAKKVLVQMGTIARLSGWQEQPTRFTKDGTDYDGFEITRLGDFPYAWVSNEATITIANRSLSSATVLDAAGYPTDRPCSLQRQGATVTLTMPADANYVILE